MKEKKILINVIFEMSLDLLYCVWAATTANISPSDEVSGNNWGQAEKNESRPEAL